LLPRLGAVSFVKIDVEGPSCSSCAACADYMRGLIEHDRAIIMAEVTDEWLSALGGSARAVGDLLCPVQCVLYAVSSQGLSALESPPREQVELVAFPAERALPARAKPRREEAREHGRRGMG
jgi:hypothetical protein